MPEHPKPDKPDRGGGHPGPPDKHPPGNGDKPPAPTPKPKPKPDRGRTYG